VKLVSVELRPFHKSSAPFKDHEVPPLKEHSHVSNQCAKAIRMLHPAPKSVSRIRPTYGVNTGVLGAKVMGRVGSCSSTYRAYTTPANAEMIRIYSYFSCFSETVGR